jgi:hypothetical protein
MTQKTSQSQASSKTQSLPVVLFGPDPHGKPTAARFVQHEVALAVKAAEQLHLRVLCAATPAVAELAAKLPAGRIHASGKGFVPNVRTDLYTKLVAAAGPAAGTTASQPSSSAAAGSRSNGNGSSPKNGAADRPPRNWDEIAVGHVVVAQEGPEDGWYDAVVVEVAGDMCTLRWCDYPRERRFARHRRSLALLCPNAQVQAPTSTTADQPAEPSAGKTTVAKSGPVAQGFPLSWGDIDVGHLVLAKDDSPIRSWWEAIAAEKHGDVFSLRWRDQVQLPAIERTRLSLALLCPNAK